MEGSRSVGDERVPQLIARAKDGSSFRLSSVEVQYALLPGAAALALEDSAVSGSLRAKLLAAAARSVLRDELGRVTAEEIVRGACGPEVGAAATVRLNAMLAPHGVEVLGVVLGKPGFDEEYEEAIRRRAAFAQETERLDADLARISADRPRKVAATAREKELELASLEGVLAVDRGVARSQGIRVRQEADDFYRSEVEIARRRGRRRRSAPRCSASATRPRPGRSTARESSSRSRAISPSARRSCRSSRGSSSRSRRTILRRPRASRGGKP
jgi:hypothetical protein